MTRMQCTLVIGALAIIATSCAPTESQIDDAIVEMYTNNGAENIEVTLEPDGDGGYEGHVDFRDPTNDEVLRHNCTVDSPEGGEAQWRCFP